MSVIDVISILMIEVKMKSNYIHITGCGGPEYCVTWRFLHFLEKEQKL